VDESTVREKWLLTDCSRRALIAPTSLGVARRATRAGHHTADREPLSRLWVTGSGGWALGAHMFAAWVGAHRHVWEASRRGSSSRRRFGQAQGLLTSGVSPAAASWRRREISYITLCARDFFRLTRGANCPRTRRPYLLSATKTYLLTVATRARGRGRTGRLEGLLASLTPGSAHCAWEPRGSGWDSGRTKLPN
jgi:hypothetical protein